MFFWQFHNFSEFWSKLASFRWPNFANFGQNIEKLWFFKTWAYAKYSISLRIGGRSGPFRVSPKFLVNGDLGISYRLYGKLLICKYTFGWSWGMLLVIWNIIFRQEWIPMDKEGILSPKIPHAIRIGGWGDSCILQMRPCPCQGSIWDIYIY